VESLGLCILVSNSKLDDGQSPMTADHFSTSYTIVGTVRIWFLCRLYVCHHTVRRILMQSLTYA